MSTLDSSAFRRTETPPASTGQEKRRCFCLEGWVFVGSLSHDGEEIVESIRCRKCGGTGHLRSPEHEASR